VRNQDDDDDDDDDHVVAIDRTLTDKKMVGCCE
jgi:hypothetical protein